MTVVLPRIGTTMLIATILLTGLAIMPRAQGRWIQTSHGQGAERIEYRLFLPAVHDGSTPLPLVVMLHGCTQSAADFAAGTRMAELAQSRGFLVAFPEQRPDAHPQRCWSWYDPAHQRRGAGEPARIAGLVKAVLRDHAVDEDRVYIGGISAGGAMSAIVAAAYPELFAAVAVHSGVAYGAARNVAQALRVMHQGPAEGAPPAEALRHAGGGAGGVAPLLVLHGEADAVVHPRNADALAAQWAGAADGRPDREPARRRRQGASGGRAFTRTEIRRGSGGPLLVEHWSVAELGHAWSGGAPEGSFTDPAGPDASLEMVEFFLARSRSREQR